MSETPPVLLPIFRSEHQMRILVEVFWGPKPMTGSELARRTGIPQPTVAREVARLERSGLVTTATVGTAKTIAPNPNLPYGNALRQLLAYAGGIVPLLARLAKEAPGIDEVFIFGSWASRFHGETGPPANDIDVAIVSSTVTRFDLAEARLALETSTGLEINLFVLEPASERLAELRDGSVPVHGPRIAA